MRHGGADMAEQPSQPGDPGPPHVSPLYRLALEAAEEASARALEQMRELHNRYPEGVPPEFTRPPDGTADRRSAPRFCGPRDEVVLYTLRPRREVSGRVLNRSWGGVSLLTARPVEVGSVLGLRTVGRWGTAPALVEVRYCQALRGRWVVGCEFARLPG